MLSDERPLPQEYWDILGKIQNSTEVAEVFDEGIIVDFVGGRLLHIYHTNKATISTRDLMEKKVYTWIIDRDHMMDIELLKIIENIVMMKELA